VTATPTLRHKHASAGLAQLVERQFCKLDVAGSIPATGTISPSLAKSAQDTLLSKWVQLRHDGYSLALSIINCQYLIDITRFIDHDLELAGSGLAQF
jgi:hypothetical protein